MDGGPGATTEYGVRHVDDREVLPGVPGVVVPHPHGCRGETGREPYVTSPTRSHHWEVWTLRAERTNNPRSTHGRSSRGAHTTHSPYPPSTPTCLLRSSPLDVRPGPNTHRPGSRGLHSDHWRRRTGKPPGPLLEGTHPGTRKEGREEGGITPPSVLTPSTVRPSGRTPVSTRRRRTPWADPSDRR